MLILWNSLTRGKNVIRPAIFSWAMPRVLTNATKWHLCHMCCSFYHTSSFAARSSFMVDFETQECGDVSAWRNTGFYQNSGIRPTYQPKQFSCVFFNCARNDFEAVKSFDSTVSVVSAHFRLRTLKLSPKDYLPIFWHNLKPTTSFEIAFSVFSGTKINMHQTEGDYRKVKSSASYQFFNIFTEINNLF